MDSLEDFLDKDVPMPVKNAVIAATEKVKRYYGKMDCVVYALGTILDPRVI